MVPKVITSIVCILICCHFSAGAVGAGKKNSTQSPLVECSIYPALPDGLTAFGRGEYGTAQAAQTIILSNGFVAVEISASSGVIRSIENKLVNERHPLGGDETGISFTSQAGEKVEWFAREGVSRQFEVQLVNDDAGCSAVLTTKLKNNSGTVTLTYRLRKDQFWAERRISVESGKVTYHRLVYGKTDITGTEVKTLKLGKFDSPQLSCAGKGGVFSGVGWWFYEVQNGLYQNTDMNYATEKSFDAEPWYVGVFKTEVGEPYPGWAWYKTFLHERKRAYDKQSSYFTWNARSGYSFHPISNPGILDFVETATSIGLDAITTGEVRGLEKGTELAATDLIARKVVDAFTDRGIEVGLHEGNVNATNWRSDAGLAKKIQAIDRAAEQKFRNMTVDFFSVDDTFATQRRAAQFFRHLREKMDYTECHLGMAAYGPQFQREVLINHPTDVHGFDISRFSGDWATFVAFRQSRRKWQQKFEYLMPENGLYYFSSHYSNYPRRYEEPEPQQFLYIADAWRGLAYAFHDKIGFRDSMAAQAAFSSFYVFGFLDAHMPQADKAFARDYLSWVKANADVLSRGRVCMETEEVVVMSKIRDGCGAIFAVNYTPGKKRFQMKLDIPWPEKVAVRQIYPQRENTIQIEPGAELEVDIPGERLAIFEINNGLQGLPPENRRDFPIDVVEWQPAKGGFKAAFVMPDVRDVLSRQKDESLPKRIVSADQTQTEFVTNKPAGKSMGPLPKEFLSIYGFEENKFLQTWKVVPWAFADRVWFVYAPENPTTIVGQRPMLRVNGKAVEMHPRVAYNTKTRLAKPETWAVPMWFADVTEICKFGSDNQLLLTTPDAGNNAPKRCYITAAVSMGADNE